MLPRGTPVLVTWPGLFPVMRGAIADGAADGSVYYVACAGGRDLCVIEGALIDLRLFPDTPAASFAAPGCA